MHILHYTKGTNNFVVEVDENSSIDYKESSVILDMIGVINDEETLSFRNSTLSFINEKNKEKLQSEIRNLKNTPDYEMKFVIDDDTVKALLAKNLSIKYLIFQSIINIFVDKNE